MRKRIASIVLSVCLCLTLLPTAALADGPDSGGSPTITICNHALGEGGKCTKCGETLIAEVTKTTEGGTAISYLASGTTIPEQYVTDDFLLIFSAFGDPSTTRVKLLANVTGKHNIAFSSPNQTLDLNGHTLDTVGGSIALLPMGGIPSVTITDSSAKTGELKAQVQVVSGSLTINSGTLTAETQTPVDEENYTTSPGPITIEGGAMTVSGTAKVDCSTITVASSSAAPSLTVQDSAQITGGITVSKNGSLTMTGGTVTYDTITQPQYTGVLHVNGGTAKISGGSIYGLAAESGSVELSGGTYTLISVPTNNTPFSSATDLLKPGYAYFTKAEGSEDYTLTAPNPPDPLSNIANVTVKPHECDFRPSTEDSRFTCACGRTATQLPIAYVDENGKTAYCTTYTEINSSYISTNSSTNCIEMEGDGTWYVVTENINTPKISLSGNSHLILKNNITATLTAGIEGAANKTLTIYGQPTAVPGATGKLVVETTESTEGGIYSKGDLTVNGGEITVTVSTSLTASSTPYYRPNGIYSVAAANKLTVNGGSLTVTAPGHTNAGSVEVFGVYAGELTVNGGELTVTSQNIESTNGQVKSCGIFTRKLTMTKGEVSATGAVVEVTCTNSESGNPPEGSSTGISVEEDGDGTGVATITGGKLTAIGGNATTSGAARSMSAWSEGLYASELSVANATVNATGGSASVTSTTTATDPDLSSGSYGISADMTVKSDSSITAKSGTAEATGCDNAYVEALDLYGDLTMQGGTLTDGTAAGSVLVSLNALTMTGGTMKLKKDSELMSVSASPLNAPLMEGYAYYEVNRQWAYETGLTETDIGFVTLGNLTALNSNEDDSTAYYVKPCTYTAPSGTCPYCGKDFTPAPSSSGGSSSNTTSTTVKNPDGSTTTTVTNKATGTVTETTKNTDGSTTTIETRKDGTVTETTTTPNGTTSTTVTDKNGNSTTTVSVSKKDAQSGNTVPLPVDEVTAGNSENATEITVNVPSGGATVEIPVKNPTPGTVIVIVDENGNEAVVPTTKQTENGVSVTLTEDATIKVIENSKDFSDVKSSDYFGKAVDWASSRGITGGVGENHFAPNEPCSRAQLVTFLYRYVQSQGGGFTGAWMFQLPFSDVPEWCYEAVAWCYMNNIVGGYGNGQFGSDDTITREQMAVILYRFAQKTGMDTTQGGMAVREYKDYDSISDYAVTAIQWAVNAGVMQGYDGNLMPGQPCTRAQIMTMLYRLLGTN